MGAQRSVPSTLNTYRSTRNLAVTPVLLPCPAIRSHHAMPTKSSPRKIGSVRRPSSALICLHDAQSTFRRDRHINVLAGDFAEAARNPVVKHRKGLHRSLPVIWTIGSRSWTDFFDVSSADFLIPSHRRVRAFNSLPALNEARAAKRRRYQTLIVSSGGRRFVLVPIYILGG